MSKLTVCSIIKKVCNGLYSAQTDNAETIFIHAIKKAAFNPKDKVKVEKRAYNEYIIIEKINDK